MIVNITGPDVIAYQPMPPSDHEEADTRICVHLKDAMPVKYSYELLTLT